MKAEINVNLNEKYSLSLIVQTAIIVDNPTAIAEASDFDFKKRVPVRELIFSNILPFRRMIRSEFHVYHCPIGSLLAVKNCWPHS